MLALSIYQLVYAAAAANVLAFERKKSDWFSIRTKKANKHRIGSDRDHISGYLFFSFGDSAKQCAMMTLFS